MHQDIERLKQEFELDWQSADNAQETESLRVKYLGRKAFINELFTRIVQMPALERGNWGKELNQVKQYLTARIAEKGSSSAGQEARLDLTYPALNLNEGSRHVLVSVMENICGIFEKLGFIVAWGNETEDEWHNFAALNFPQDHPSRDSFDTFYLDLPATKFGKSLLRCHTSPSQPRIMKEHKPPLAVVSPGRVYRPDEVDATHSFMFHQIEGFAVAEDINFAQLKGVLLSFARQFFSPDVNIRLRPHYFPFTEPSAEADISCFLCKGKRNPEKKCSVCKDKGWIEVLGCGMIHPNVLENCEIDSKKYQGFAFGMGVERIAMLKYGITDIRLFYENDKRFLEQF